MWEFSLNIKTEDFELAKYFHNTLFPFAKTLKGVVTSNEENGFISILTAIPEKESNKMKNEYEARLKSANEESDEIIRKAIRKAHLREEEILNEARAEADRTLERAEEQIELEKKHAINQVKEQVAGLAIDIAEAIIERDINESEHKSLIDSFIDEVGEDNE